MSGTYTQPYTQIAGPVVIDPGPLTVNGDETVNGTSNLNGPVNVAPGPLTVAGDGIFQRVITGQGGGFTAFTLDSHSANTLNSASNTANTVSAVQLDNLGTGANNSSFLNINSLNAFAIIQLFSKPASVSGSTLTFGSDITGSLSPRVKLLSQGLETGANVGSDFFIQPFSDAGASLGNAFSIVRATGQTQIIGNGGVLRLNQTPPAAALVGTNYFNINLNGTVYRVPCLL